MQKLPFIFFQNHCFTTKYETFADEQPAKQAESKSLLVLQQSLTMTYCNKHCMNADSD